LTVRTSLGKNRRDKGLFGGTSRDSIRPLPERKVVSKIPQLLRYIAAGKQRRVMKDWNDSDWFKTWLKLARKGKKGN
jgi:hypothetical protein